MTGLGPKKLRMGIVGCGAVVTLHHLPAFKRCDRVELVALADRDRAWAAKVAPKAGVREVYDDFAAMIGRVDAVLLATPNTTHAAIACPLLEAGVHVLCEKPMATTSADAERMFAASARGGGRLMAAHSARFNANVTMLKDLLAAGWIGDLQEMSGGLGSAYDVAERRTEFRREPGLAGGGVLVDLGIHLIDVAVWLAGSSPISVEYDASCADGWCLETDCDVAIEFPRGACANLSVSYTHGPDPTFTVRGTAGWASASLYVPSQLTLFSRRARICRRSGVQRLMLDDRPPYERQLEHFADAILTGRDFVVRTDEVRTDLDIIERCYEIDRRRAEATHGALSAAADAIAEGTGT
jgi:predicted dehydrogenase